MPGNPTALSEVIRAAIHSQGSFFCDAAARVQVADVVQGSSLDGHNEELRGRSVLIATHAQLAAALALIELDGVALRLVLCPPDLPLRQLVFAAQVAEAEAIVSDRRDLDDELPGVRKLLPCAHSPAAALCDRIAPWRTQWILLTSGTTGAPKMVVHNLATLAGAFRSSAAPAEPPVWSTFYDIRRYGGLQIFLRALFSGASLVLSSEEETTAAFLRRAGALGVTHISGTPSHWRRALMSPAASLINPTYVRLSGEIADQTILDRLQSAYPQARVAHAFASTEAGLAFEVNDGLAGFPASLVGSPHGSVDLKVEDGSLRVRSARTALGYLGQPPQALQDADGFVDTGDILELRDGRYYFAGRRDGVVNVGGSKVHPEEVEAVINRHPQVQMSLVKTKKSPITGALVVADVVLRAGEDIPKERIPELQRDILGFCHQALPPHKVPASITFVPTLAVAESGKLMRYHA